MSVHGFLGTSMHSCNIVKLGCRPSLLCLPSQSLRSHEQSSWGHPRCIIQTPSGLQKRRTEQSMEKFFINALVKASTCHEHGGTSSPILRMGPSMSHKARRKLIERPYKLSRGFHSPSRTTQQVVTPQAISQDEYLHIIDYYNGAPVEEGSATYTNQALQLPAFEDVAGDLPFQKPTQKPSERVHQNERDVIGNAARIILDDESHYEEVYKAYLTLPFPGVYYLTPHERNKLLQRLAVVERKQEKVLLRYLSVLDDMKAANIPLHRHHWNSSIHLAGRSLSKVTAVEVESALRMWREMEEDANVEGNDVTYNILFNIAVRAEKPALAEMILKEMQTQEQGLNRYAYVDLIYYYGIRGDCEKIRQTYIEYVKSGQIVDTVVLNCVITSLLRAGELQAADHVYQRMRNIHAKQTGMMPPPNDWKRTRELGRVLYRAARDFAKAPELCRKLQDQQCLAPNVRTYVIFLEHHVSRTGEMQSIAKLLDEMQCLSLPLSGRIFMELFRGFALHGGLRYTMWTGPRLEGVWRSFIDLADQNLGEVYIAKWLSIWTLRAFMSCCGKERALGIWDELKSRWKPSEYDEKIAQDILSGEDSTPFTSSCDSS